MLLYIGGYGMYYQFQLMRQMLHSQYAGLYIVLGVLGLFFGFVPQLWIRSTVKKWAKVSTNRYTVQDSVQKVLVAKRLNIGINFNQGLTNAFYDPSQKAITVDSQTWQTGSIAASAIALHELGHALQDQENYMPNKIRAALVGPVNFISNLSMVVTLVGMGLTMFFGYSPLIMIIAILGYLATLVFQLATLPVEFDASRRAITLIRELNLFDDESQINGARTVLRSAAFTYVAATLATFIQILRFILQILVMFSGSNDRR